LLSDFGQCHVGILDDVVEKGADDRRGTQADFSDTDPRDLNRMQDVWLTGFPALETVGFYGKFVGFRMLSRSSSLSWSALTDFSILWYARRISFFSSSVTAVNVFGMLNVRSD
jgi:hypothetical protein